MAKKKTRQIAVSDKGYSSAYLCNPLVVGNVAESRIYLDRKKAAALKAGLEFEEKQISENVQMPEILETIENLNRDPSVHGIIIQLPIPKHLDEQVFSVVEFSNERYRNIRCVT